MKVVLCAIAKNEHLYINDWCKHHLKIGFDHIYIFDNDDESSPKMSQCLDAEIVGRVSFFNIRGMHEKNMQQKCYTKFYTDQRNDFDWCAFFDLDEYLDGVDDVHKWLMSIPSAFQQVRVKFRTFTDGDRLFRNMLLPVNKSLTQTAVINKDWLDSGMKAIVRGKLDDCAMISVHFASKVGARAAVLPQCLPSGRSCNNDLIALASTKYTLEKVFLNHYRSKTLNEFLLQKLNRTDAVYDNRRLSFKYFWQSNVRTAQKNKYLSGLGFTKDEISGKSDIAQTDKIDIIVTWVDPNDEAWRTDYDKYRGDEIVDGKQRSDNIQAFGDERVRDWDCFAYWFRCVERNCPWVRKVFLVVQQESQLPKWLNINNPKLRIVYHSEFVPEDLLPTFNIFNIDMWFYRIPDLSNNFITCNDDFYFLNPISRTMFFKNGKCVQTTAKQKNGRLYYKETTNWKKVCNNNIRFIKEHIDDSLASRFNDSHLPEARQKDFEKAFMDKYYDIIHNAALKSRFRHPEQYMSWIFIDTMRLTGPHKVDDSQFANCCRLELTDGSEIRGIEDKSIVCFNDTQNTVFEKAAPILQAFLHRKFPEPSSFEIYDSVSSHARLMYSSLPPSHMNNVVESNKQHIGRISSNSVLFADMAPNRLRGRLICVKGMKRQK